MKLYDTQPVSNIIYLEVRRATRTYRSFQIGHLTFELVADLGGKVAARVYDSKREELTWLASNSDKEGCLASCLSHLESKFALIEKLD